MRINILQRNSFAYLYSALGVRNAKSLSTCTERLVEIKSCLAKQENLDRMESIVSQIPELQRPHVHIKNIVRVGEKIKKIIEGNHHKLQVITDFDHTLTKYHGKNQTCYGVIENYSRMPAKFKVETRNLFEKYYPIEIDPHLSVEEKLPHMIQWYDKAHDLMLQCDLYKKDFTLMTEETPLKFRDRTSELMDTLHENQVPILVFSAGIGDVIDAALKFNNLMNSNVKVIANFMEFDEEEKFLRFTGQLIHMFNKNESAIRNSSYFQEIADRHNVILMGDSLGDLRMAEGIEPPSTVLNIGFLNNKIEERLSLYMDQFDIVLVDDQTFDIPCAIVKLILKEESK